MLRYLTLTVALVLGALPLSAQEHKQAEDSAFTALKKRGGSAMNVDQDKSAHLFDALPDGGRIELQATTDDPQAIAGIRQHFREIESAFRQGDFAIPMFVHGGEVPGTDVMKARKTAIRYTMRELPRGAELRLQTADAEALKAIHQFMTYQRGEHHAGGMH
jgi:hypothetical protein